MSKVELEAIKSIALLDREFGNNFVGTVNSLIYLGTQGPLTDTSWSSDRRNEAVRVLFRVLNEAYQEGWSK